jgi:hypothetical protein
VAIFKEVGPAVIETGSGALDLTDLERQGLLNSDPLVMRAKAVFPF